MQTFETELHPLHCAHVCANSFWSSFSPFAATTIEAASRSRLSGHSHGHGHAATATWPYPATQPSDRVLGQVRPRPIQPQPSGHGHGHPATDTATRSPPRPRPSGHGHGARPRPSGHGQPATASRPRPRHARKKSILQLVIFWWCLGHVSAASCSCSAPAMFSSSCLLCFVGLVAYRFCLHSGSLMFWWRLAYVVAFVIISCYPL